MIQLYTYVNCEKGDKKMYVNKKNIKHDTQVFGLIICFIAALSIVTYGIFWLLKHKTIAIITVIILFSMAGLMIIYYRYFCRNM